LSAHSLYGISLYSISYVLINIFVRKSCTPNKFSIKRCRSRVKTSRNSLMTKRDKVNSSTKLSVLWIHPFTLDSALHKKDFLEILEALTKRNHNVNLIAIRSKRFQPNPNSNVNIHTIPLRGFPVLSPILFAITLCFLLPVYIIKYKPDFIISRPDVSVLGSIFSLPICKLKRIKLVLDIRSTPVETKGLRGFLQNIFFVPSVRVAKSLFDGMTIITHLMREEVSKRFKLSPNAIGVWTSGVNTVSFNPKNRINECIELRTKLGLTGKFVVFYHGIMTATRGLTETIDALNKLKDSNAPVVFFLLGTGPLVPTLKKLVREKKLESKVVIHDPVKHNKVPKYIAMSDVCISPLPNHPFWNFQSPLKLLEYLAMEKVVIATDIPAHRLIIDGKGVIYIPSTEPAEIANGIMIAYNNIKNLAKWGKHGRDLVIKNFEWKKVAEDLERYLLSLDEN
jgi:glycosyltransferase involved in cell wall biosynthesis